MRCSTWFMTFAISVTALITGTPLGAQAQTANGPTFDCAKAQSRVEKLICASAELGRLDVELLRTYRLVIAVEPDQNALKSAQLAWLKQRNQCVDAICIRELYKMRIAQLQDTQPDDPNQQIGQSVPKPPTFGSGQDPQRTQQLTGMQMAQEAERAQMKEMRAAEELQRKQQAAGLLMAQQAREAQIAEMRTNQELESKRQIEAMRMAQEAERARVAEMRAAQEAERKRQAEAARLEQDAEQARIEARRVAVEAERKKQEEEERLEAEKEAKIEAQQKAEVFAKAEKKRIEEEENERILRDTFNQDVLFLYDSRIPNSNISKSLSGNITISKKFGSGYCFSSFVNQVLLWDRTYRMDIQSDARDRSINEKADMQGFYSFFLSQVAKGLPDFTMAETLPDKNGEDCRRRIYATAGNSDGIEYRPLYIMFRFETLKGGLPPGVEIAFAVPMKEFDAIVADRKEKARATLDAEQLLIKEVMDGSKKGAGLLRSHVHEKIVLPSGAVNFREAEEFSFCVEKKDIATWDAIEPNDPSHKLFELTDKFGKQRSAYILQMNLDESFVAFKGGKCKFFLGVSDSIRSMGNALSRDQVAYDLDKNWISEAELKRLTNVGLDTIKKREQEALRQRQEELARQQAEARCNADAVCSAKKQKEAEAAEAKRKAALPPYRAIISCTAGNARALVYACFTESSTTAGGSFSTRINGERQAYALQDFAQIMNRTEVQLDLSQSFSLQAQSNGSRALVLEIRVIDRNDAVVFQKQAVAYGVIQISN